nr:probable inactive ATP-dependent zinc metalloprotease FTSHI 4, chloroplastic [Ipomoea batatas]
MSSILQQMGTFETGQEDSTEVPEELELRLAYREAAVAVVACYIPDPYRPFTETDVNSIRNQPNMQYTEKAGRVFKKKSDYVNAIVRACAPRVIEEEMFGVDNLCWISANATLEASRLAEVLILQTGMTALGKAYYRYQRDLVPNLAAKVEVLRDEYIRFAVEKCTSILKENQAAVEAITGSRRKRTRKLDIIHFEGGEGPSDVAIEGKQDKSKKQRVGRHGLPIVKSMASSPQYVDIKLFLTDLSYALLKSYNPMNGKLTLKDGLMLDVTEDGVEAILGFP